MQQFIGSVSESDTESINCWFVEKKIRPQDKWNAKAGYISKSYKLKKDVVESFAKACEQAQTSQAGQLTKMMQQFIESVSNSDTEKQQ